VILKTVILLAGLKIVGTAVSYASGNAGGIFGPSMFIGAMVGAAVGQLAHVVFPASTAGPGAYALVGMGAAFAGILRTPLTSVIMIFEVTRDYTIIVPLMIANLIAYFISQKLQKIPIYEALAQQDGMHLPTGAFRSRSLSLRVAGAIREPPESLVPSMKVGPAAEAVSGKGLDSWPVADEMGLIGMVRVSDIMAAVDGGHLGASIATVMERAREADGQRRIEVPHVHGDQPLGQALARMGDTRHNVLPVVSRANIRIMLGVVTLADVLRAYGVERADQLDYIDRPDQ
jgi:CIC family chloride channel protein